MAKRSDGISKVEDIDEKEFLSILDGRATPSALPQKRGTETPEQESPDRGNQAKDEVSVSDRQEIFSESISAKPVSKRKQGEIYESKFLQPRELKIRQCVYISRNVHETIADIVKRIGERGLTVGVYIDTILQQHLQENKEEINSLYCKPTDRIIK